jgi:uncharacterized membrane protein YeaQ/YmgE (transglycosylase-associated protein family)
VGIISWIIFGAIAGWLANTLIGTKNRSGCIFNIVIGIIGAFIGGSIFEYIGEEGVTGFNFWSLIVATLGAMLLLWVVNKISKANK